MANRKEERRNNNNENRTEAEVSDVAFLRAINTKKNKIKIMKDQGNKQQGQERAIRHKRAPMTINHHEIFPATAGGKKNKLKNKRNAGKQSVEEGKNSLGSYLMQNKIAAKFAAIRKPMPLLRASERASRAQRERTEREERGEREKTRCEESR